jgi:hypothetical protein
MRDYSLHLVASRPARVGDKVVTTKFGNSIPLVASLQSKNRMLQYAFVPAQAGASSILGAINFQCRALVKIPITTSRRICDRRRIAVGINEGAFSERVSQAYWGDVLPDSYVDALPLIQWVRKHHRPRRGPGHRPLAYGGRPLKMRVAYFFAGRYGGRRRLRNRLQMRARLPKRRQCGIHSRDQAREWNISDADEM